VSALPSISRPSQEAAAAGVLYERHADRIRGFCFTRLRSREEAEDAAQQTFLNAFRALRRGVLPVAEVPWLLKIAENVCHERQRSAQRRSRLESPRDAQVLEQVPAAASDSDDGRLAELREALAQMPERQRRALLLREWQGLSYAEIAAELRVSQSAVETLIFRSRRTLARFADRQRTRVRSLAGDLASVLSALKSALSGGAALKTAAAVLAVATAGAVAAPEVGRRVERAFDGPPAPVRPAPSRVINGAGPALTPSAPTSAPARPHSHRAHSQKPGMAARPAGAPPPATGETPQQPPTARQDDPASQPTGQGPTLPTPPAPPSVETPSLPPAPGLPVTTPQLPVEPPALPGLDAPSLPPTPAVTPPSVTVPTPPSLP
jgi:RNA polymerase sigma-70 factor (ECF subfamily)